MGNLVGLLGVIFILLVAYLMSNNRKAIKWRVVSAGLLLQLIFGILVMRTTPGRMFFDVCNRVIIRLLSFTNEGSGFLFGTIISGKPVNMGFVFAFQVLPTIIFVSSLMSIAYYLGVMQKIVEIFARIFVKIMGTSGAESLSNSANIFVGQTEAPLLIKPYVSEMTNSELMTVMVGGFATVAGGVMAAYVGMLKDYIPNIAGFLLTASIMAAPAGLALSKMVYPETGEPKTKGMVKIPYTKTDVNVIDAAANGASAGLTLAFNVGGMLLAFIALIAMLNFGFAFVGNIINSVFGTSVSLSLQLILSWIFSPVAWLMGVPWQDCRIVGQFLGEKLVLNEFVAYLNMMKQLVVDPNLIGPKAKLIASFALCGFANFSSIAIQIGGIGGIAPDRRHDLAKLGLRAMVVGTLANLMTGTIAGILFTG
ncbi:MAG: NupC/NupG family nucleoside CNT transporter [Elusimicrobia bacterium]|nr:NupC/NupG family nucleoside CNT transporter [Elusimicrobiota bacterium]